MEVAATVIIVFLFLVIVFVATAFFLEFAGVVMFTVPFLPVRMGLVRGLPSMIELRDGDVFLDLGSGDGRVVRTVAMTYPSATCIGIELAPLPRVLSRVGSIITPLKNVRFVSKDFRAMDLSQATHIYCYLLTDAMNDLLPKLQRELRPGTKLVSCEFRFKDKPYVSKRDVKSGARTYTLYFYEF